jgi:hypothetical protein
LFILRKLLLLQINRAVEMSDAFGRQGMAASRVYQGLNMAGTQYLLVVTRGVLESPTPPSASLSSVPF